jgi:hypothetical protein
VVLFVQGRRLLPRGAGSRLAPNWTPELRIHLGSGGPVWPHCPGVAAEGPRSRAERSSVPSVSEEREWPATPSASGQKTGQSPSSVSGARRKAGASYSEGSWSATAPRLVPRSAGTGLEAWSPAGGPQQAAWPASGACGQSLT